MVRRHDSMFSYLEMKSTITDKFLLIDIEQVTTTLAEVLVYLELSNKAEAELSRG